MNLSCKFLSCKDFAGNENNCNCGINLFALISLIVVYCKAKNLGGIHEFFYSSYNLS